MVDSVSCLLHYALGSTTLKDAHFYCIAELRSGWKWVVSAAGECRELSTQARCARSLEESSDHNREGSSLLPPHLLFPTTRRSLFHQLPSLPGLLVHIWILDQNIWYAFGVMLGGKNILSACWLRLLVEMNRSVWSDLCPLAPHRVIGRGKVVNRVLKI